MTQAAAKFTCGGCQRSYTWKPELAGKRVKCKCGQPISVPKQIQSPPAVEEGEVDLYSLADAAADAQRQVAGMEPTIVDPVAIAAAAPAPMAKARAGGGIPLEYQKGPTAKETQRSSSATFIDKKRDYQVPIALMAVGIILYIAFYAWRYQISGAGLMATGLGLLIIGIFETAILVGFALVAAGPLNVSFGGVGTAILKLAAIALFCDGVTAWVDGVIGKYTGGFGSGVLGFGIIGFPIALAVYWSTLVYLFSMDSGDSWMFVSVVAFFYRIIRIILVILVLPMILEWAGVPKSAIAIPGIGGAPQAADPLVEEVEQAKTHKLLQEARAWVKAYNRSAEGPSVEGWYGANAPNVWYEVERDAAARTTAFAIVVEMPKAPVDRAKCYAIAKAYYDTNKQFYDPTELQDTGEPYLIVHLPMQP